MTTIVADARTGEMVSDSKCSDDRTWWSLTKIHRVGDELIGCSGDVKEHNQFLKWYRAGKRGARPKSTEGYTALILGPSGVRQYDSNGCEIPMECGYGTIGSGGHAALAALMCGKTPTEAVGIAMQIDPHSGGEIQRHTLKEV